MPIYHLAGYSENYAKTSAFSQEYCRDEPDDNTTNSKAFRFKSSIIDNTDNARITNVNRVLPLKGLSNFWRTLEMKPINCEVTLDLNW